MSASKSLVHYQDIRAILDAAISKGGGRFELPTPGKATHWRQRAHTFRKLLVEAEYKHNLIPGIVPTTPYDDWELTIDPVNKCIVVISPLTKKGKLTDMQGNDIDIARKPDVDGPRDDLSDAAADLLKRLSL